MTKEPSLDPEADELFYEARGAFEPARSRVTAVREAIAVRVGATAAASASSASSEAAATSSAATSSATTTAATTTAATTTAATTTAATTTSGTLTTVTASFSTAHWIGASVLAAVLAGGAVLAAREATREPAPEARSSEARSAPAAPSAPLNAELTVPPSAATSVQARTPQESAAAPVAIEVERDAPMLMAKPQPTDAVGRVQQPAVGRVQQPAVGRVASDIRAPARVQKSQGKLAATAASRSREPQAAIDTRDEKVAVARKPVAPEPALPIEALAQEVDLLRQARSALEGKHARQSLALLDRYASLFPRGTLRQEALATRVLALCQAERKIEARNVANQLARLAPQSPHLIRLASSCAMQKDDRADDDTPSQ